MSDPTSSGSTQSAPEVTPADEVPEHTERESERWERERWERERRERERQKLALLGTINEMGDKIRSDAQSNWHLSIEAPRWAVRTPDANARTSVAAGVVAFLLGGLAFWLAWHATDKLVGSHSALTVQIGPWTAVAALLVGAGVAAYAAIGSSRLHLRMTQLADGETPAKALAASASSNGQGAGSAGASSTSGNLEIAAAHAIAADQHAAAAAGAAGHAPDAAPAAASAAASAASAHASVAGAAVSGGSGSGGSSSSTQDPTTVISPKVWAGGIAGGISFTFWTIATATFWKSTFSSDVLAALVGSTTVILSAAAAYLRTDPLRVKPGT
jgi:hypothetical protein